MMNADNSEEVLTCDTVVMPNPGQWEHSSKRRATPEEPTAAYPQLRCPPPVGPANAKPLERGEAEGRDALAHELLEDRDPQGSVVNG